MYISSPTLDDLLRRVLEKLLRSRHQVRATRGETKEMSGVLLRLTNPRARLSRTEKKGTLFSCLGELLWYLAKTDAVKFIAYYIKDYREDSEDGRTIRGAYGPRLFNTDGCDQIANIVALLRSKPASRRAVVQLFRAGDIASDHHRDVPCTCSLQFLLRDDRLNMIAYMRSNDAFRGLPHDVFAFTMLQELIARTLGVELGTYKHFVGSLHLYAENLDATQQYVAEGWQPTIDVTMPPMPAGDPWSSIAVLLRAERAIRLGRPIVAEECGLDPYWEDIVRILQFFRAWKCRKQEGAAAAKKMAAIKRRMKFPIYNMYIAKKQTSILSVPRADQLPLFPCPTDETVEGT